MSIFGIGKNKKTSDRNQQLPSDLDAPEFPDLPEEDIVDVPEFSSYEPTIKDIKNEIKDSFLPPNFKGDHEEKYKMICRFVHPNHESFKLHLNRTDDQQFEFLVPNIHLAMWHSVGIIKLFSDARLLNFDKNINQEDLVELQRE